MKYVFRALCVVIGIVVVIAITVGILAMVSEYQSHEYDKQSKMAFNAATLSYLSGDPERTIISEYEGARYEVNPDNYRSLNYYLRAYVTRSFLPRSLSDKIEISVCGTDKFSAYKVDEETAIVIFDSAEDTWRMRVHYDDLWKELVKFATVGGINTPNILLE